MWQLVDSVEQDYSTIVKKIGWKRKVEIQIVLVNLRQKKKEKKMEKKEEDREEEEENDSN
jgi:hypothetical protein